MKTITDKGCGDCRVPFGCSHGFTIVEVLIAISILSIALIALASLATTSMKASEAGRRLTQATNLASEKLEALKASPFTNIQSDGTATASFGSIARACDDLGSGQYTCTPATSPETLDNMPYTWWWTVTYVDMDGDGVFPNPVNGEQIDDEDLKRIDVFVTWTDLMGGHTFRIVELRGKTS